MPSARVIGRPASTGPEHGVALLRYPAMRLRWCGAALWVFLRRWGGYGWVGAVLLGAGSNNPIDSVGAVAAWLVLPLFKAASRPAWLAAAVLVQAALGAWLVWAMRPLLWPVAWRAAELALPIPRRARLASDATVVALGLLPVLVLYVIGAATWWAHQPAWLMPWWPQALVGLVGVMLGSWGAGVAVLQALRQPARPSQHGPSRRAAPAGEAICRPPMAGHATACPTRPWLCRPAWVLWALPLWRGPARRTGWALRWGGLALLALTVGLRLTPPSRTGWWLAGFALVALLLSSRADRLSRAEFQPLIAACAVLPLAPQRLHRQRALLALLPALLGYGVLALTLPWASLRGAVACTYLLAGVGLCALEVVSRPLEVASQASRWWVSLVLLVALASEVPR